MRDIHIIYEGRDIYPDISVAEIWHDMYSEKQADTLTLKLNDTRRLWDVWQPKADDTLTVTSGNATTGKMYVESILPQNGAFTLHAYSAPQSIKTKRAKSWEKVRFLQLAAEIAGNHGLTLEQYGISDQTYTYAEQFNKPDFEFLQEYITLESAAFLVYDGKLVIYSEPFLENQASKGTITVDIDTAYSYKDDETNSYGKCELINGDIKGEYTAPKGGDKTLRKILPLQISSIGEANRFAKGLLRNANKSMTSGTIELIRLTSEYAAGSVTTIETDGADSYNGQAFITHLRLDYVKERSKIFFRKPLEGY